MKLLVRLLINAGALLLLPYLLSTIQVESFYIALITAIVLGLINVLVKPIVQFFALPITVLTLGVFAVLINGFFFWFVSTFIDGFVVEGFWAAVLGALYMTLVSWLANVFVEN